MNSTEITFSKISTKTNHVKGMVSRHIFAGELIAKNNIMQKLHENQQTEALHMVRMRPKYCNRGRHSMFSTLVESITLAR